MAAKKTPPPAAKFAKSTDTLPNPKFHDPCFDGGRYWRDASLLPGLNPTTLALIRSFFSHLNYTSGKFDGSWFMTVEAFCMDTLFKETAVKKGLKDLCERRYLICEETRHRNRQGANRYRLHPQAIETIRAVCWPAGQRSPSDPSKGFSGVASRPLSPKPCISPKVLKHSFQNPPPISRERASEDQTDDRFGGGDDEKLYSPIESDKMPDLPPEWLDEGLDIGEPQKIDSRPKPDVPRPDPKAAILRLATAADVAKPKARRHASVERAHETPDQREGLALLKKCSVTLGLIPSRATSDSFIAAFKSHKAVGGSVATAEAALAAIVADPVAHAQTKAVTRVFYKAKVMLEANAWRSRIHDAVAREFSGRGRSADDIRDWVRSNGLQLIPEKFHDRVLDSLTDCFRAYARDY